MAAQEVFLPVKELLAASKEMNAINKRLIPINKEVLIAAQRILFANRGVAGGIQGMNVSDKGVLRTAHGTKIAPSYPFPPEQEQAAETAPLRGQKLDSLLSQA